MTTQTATRESLELLQNNDVPVEVTLTLDDGAGNPVPNWDSVTVELVTEARGMQAVYSSAGVDPLITKQDQDTEDDPTVIVVLFPRGRLGQPVYGSYVVDVIDPTVPTPDTDDSRLTYRWGSFVVRQTRAGGELSGWITATAQQAIDAEAAARVAADASTQQAIDAESEARVAAIAALPALYGSAGELAYAQSTATQFTITTITDLTSLSIEFDVPADAIVRVEGFLPWVLSAAPCDTTLNITDWSNTLKAYSVMSNQTPAGTDYFHMRIVERIDTRSGGNAVAGHFQRKLRLTSTAAVNINANLSTIVSSLTATRVAIPLV